MGRCKRDLITWQNSGIDCADIYNRRLKGATWCELARLTPVSESTLPRLIMNWAADNGLEEPQNRAGGVQVINCIANVDKGRVWALYKARWAIKDIAIDCHCTESVVREVLGCV